MQTPGLGVISLCLSSLLAPTLLFWSGILCSLVSCIQLKSPPLPVIPDISSHQSVTLSPTAFWPSQWPINFGALRPMSYLLSPAMTSLLLQEDGGVPVTPQFSASKTDNSAWLYSVSSEHWQWIVCRDGGTDEKIHACKYCGTYHISQPRFPWRNAHLLPLAADKWTLNWLPPDLDIEIAHWQVLMHLAPLFPLSLGPVFCLNWPYNCGSRENPLALCMSAADSIHWNLQVLFSL